MPPLRKPNINWKRPFTCVYGDNYAYGFNSYKDMMEWLDNSKKEGFEDELPPSKIPTIEERAAQHMRYKLGRSQTTVNMMARRMEQDMDDPLTKKLKELKRDSGMDEVKDRRYRRPVSFAEPDEPVKTGLRRTRSYGAFTAKAASEIDNDLEAESLTIANGSRPLSRAGSIKEKYNRFQKRVQDDVDDFGSGSRPLSRAGSIKEKCSRFDKSVQQDMDDFASGSRPLSRAGSIKEKYSRFDKRVQEDVDDLDSVDIAASGLQSSVSAKSVQKQISDLDSAIDSMLDLKVSSNRKVDSSSSERGTTQGSKQHLIEIEQLSARLVEAETKLKTEVLRIKKKYQIQITELEMSLDVANKNNIELQKTIKRQALQITDLQNHYDELQRQLQTTLDQYAAAQRRCQALQGELEEIRSSFEAALRAKRAAEQMVEDAHTRINELTTINVNISASKSKLEGELAALQADYDEVSKELKLSDERYTKVSAELKHTTEILHEESERVVKIESIRKSLEVEVKNLQIRLEEVETNALVGGKRVISKLEARIRDLEIETEEEKRRHAESIKILRKKERQVKEILITAEEDHKNISLLADQVEKLNQKIVVYKRLLNEQEGMSQQSLTRVRRFQRELEAAEERAESAESNLTFIRHKHRSWVSGSQTAQQGGPNKQIYVVEEHRHEAF